MRKKRSRKKLSTRRIPDLAGQETNLRSVEEKLQPALFNPRTVTFMVLIALSVAICYANTLDNDFIHDDKIEILKNPYVQDISNISKIMTSPAWAFREEDTQLAGSNYYRPMQYLTYAVLYYFFGASAWVFHLLKILGHLSVCLLFFLIIVRHYKNSTLALIGSLLFSVHPINTEAVSWIAGITDMSCAFFFLLSLFFYLEFHRSASFLWLIGCCLSFLIGLLCKETMIAFIPLIICYEVLTHGRQLSLKHLSTVILPLTFCFSLYLGLRIEAIGSLTNPGQIRYEFLDGFQMLLNQVALLTQYLLAYFFPVSLNAYHMFDPILSLSDWRILKVLIVQLAFCGLFFLAYKTQPVELRRIMLLGIVWFIVPLIPVLLFLKRIGENVFAERYLYLPSLGLSLCLAVLMLRLWTYAPKAFNTGFLVLLLIFGWQVITRNTVWQNDLVFYETTARDSPRAALIFNNLGSTYAEHDKPTKALKALETSVAVKPNISAYKNLAVMYRGMKRLKDSAWAYDQAAKLNSTDSVIYSGLGDLYFYQNNFPEAIRAYEKSLELRPQDLRVCYNLADTYMRAGHHHQALSVFKKALGLSPPERATRAKHGMAAARAAIQASTKRDQPTLK